MERQTAIHKLMPQGIGEWDLDNSGHGSLYMDWMRKFICMELKEDADELIRMHSLIRVGKACVKMDIKEIKKNQKCLRPLFIKYQW